MRGLHRIGPIVGAFLLGALLFGAGCALRPRAGAERVPADPVAAAMAHYVALLRRVASDSVASMYTADGELLQPGMAALRGRTAIRAFLAPFDGHAVVDTATVAVAPAAIYGAVAYQWGVYHQVARLDGAPPTRFDGRFAAEWHRASDGVWYLRRLLMQPAPPGGN